MKRSVNGNLYLGLISKVILSKRIFQNEHTGVLVQVRFALNIKIQEVIKLLSNPHAQRHTQAHTPFYTSNLSQGKTH